MSNYTTEVRYICEHFAGVDNSVGFKDVNTVIEKSIPYVMPDFPIFDESYRKPLEIKILRHYYLREICDETFGVWRFRLENKLNEIMPYYNQLYKSALYEYNPLYNVDYTTERKVSDKGNTKSKSESGLNSVIDRDNNYKANETRNTANTDETIGSNEANSLYSDTPQGGLGNFDEVKGNLWLTNAQINNAKENTKGNSKTEDKYTSDNNTKDKTNRNDNSNTSFNSDITSTQDYIEHIKGAVGGQSFSAKIKEFRETLLNIDMMVIEELSTLFFSLLQ